MATRVGPTIPVDGWLTEEIWHTAPTIGDLTQREPRTGEPPSERTDVRVLHDGNYLYIGVMSYDSESSKIIGTEMSRDGLLRFDDRVEILLDTYGDQRNAFYFATDPAGALVDGLVFGNGQSNLEWDVINQGWIEDESGRPGSHFNRHDTQLSTKFQYTFRL